MIERARAAWPSSASAVGLMCLAAAHLGSPLLDGRGDPDLWWHLLYGARILADGAIPAVDWLSWSREGAPYVVTQWLGQTVLAAVHAATGPAGLSLLTWLAALAIVLLAWASTWPGSSPGDRALALAASIAVLAPVWDLYARPQVLGFVCMALLVLLASQALHKGRWSAAGLALVGVTMALWVNAHGSYVVGLAYLGLVVAGFLTERWLLGKERPHASWLLAPAIATAATLLNPYGVGAWAYPLEIGALQSTRLGVISEWVPTSMGSAVGAAFLAAVLATATAMMQARPQATHLVIFLGMSIFGLMASRHTYFSLVAFVPLLAGALRQGPVCALLGPALSRRVPGWLSGALLVASLAGAAWLNERRQAGLESWTRKIFPVAALDFAREHGVSGRVMNEISAGGWLAYHWPQEKVAIDGRLDLYGDGWFFAWLFARNGGPGWREFIDASGASVFVLQTPSALAQLLAADQAAFAVLYSDRYYSVLVRRSAQHAELISRHQTRLYPVAIFGPKGEVALQPMGF